MYLATPSERNRVTEQNFLSTFAAIEHLVLEFRRRANLERVLDPDRWPDVRRRLKGVLKEQGFPVQQRKWMGTKLSELNRVPIKDVLERFCANYAVDLSGLWPLYGSSPDLVTIRNWLVHAEPIADDLFKELLFACQNLKWILERTLLAILKWPLEKSAVSDGALSAYYAKRYWPRAQSELGRRFASGELAKPNLDRTTDYEGEDRA
jgi:hypothetical protein